MADRVAVVSHGRIEQLDTPRGLYTRPQTAFVANFVGSANVVGAAAAQKLTGTPQGFAIRPELIELVAPGSAVPVGHVRCAGQVLDVRLVSVTGSDHTVRIACHENRSVTK